MVMSKRMARFNRAVTNRTLGRLAPRLPGFGVIRHRGRKSGRDYRTPVIVFQRGEGFVVALTYGSHTDWTRNVLAAGDCELEVRGQVVRLVEPRVYVDETRSGLPFPVRSILTLFGVSEFLTLKRSTDR
ncbi:MAG: nitroreductase family deazaflavin-dependent oxidoreductase [Kutzneria sp.]|nr:nitroreductase family deazaflavin-dependent oxidoreductase [Kutzneria sp.]MBV9845828.1 nitroreductase family deazaflavin-dependent oxidoreductase [Kutzneria sp.]